jgi:hypothetical protein
LEKHQERRVMRREVPCVGVFGEASRKESVMGGCRVSEYLEKASRKESVMGRDVPCVGVFGEASRRKESDEEGGAGVVPGGERVRRAFRRETPMGLTGLGLAGLTIPLPAIPVLFHT